MHLAEKLSPGVMAPGLVQKGVAAFLWGTGGTFARVLLQFATQVVLARLLGPTDYGLFALGVVVVGVCGYFADIGIAYGLIQKQSVSRDDLRFVWTWQLLLGLLVSGAVYLCAGTLASLFAKPEAQVVFEWLAAVNLAGALTAVSTNLLKKALDYKSLQLGQIAGYFVGFVCCGIPLAATGYGLASLIVAWLVQAVVTLIVLYWKVRHPLSLKAWSSDGTQMLQYGVTVLGTNLVNWILTAADKVLVGRIFAIHTVGLYTTAFNLVNSPTSALYGNLQSVIFSSCARLQGNFEALRHVILGSLTLIVSIALPFFVVISIGAEIVIEAIYGTQWVEAAPFLAVFAFVMPFLLVWGVSTPMVWNVGLRNLECLVQLPLVLIWLVAFLAVASSPPQTVALTAAVLFALRCAVMLTIAVRTLRISTATLLQALRGGILLTIIIGTIAAIAVPQISSIVQNAQLRLALLLAITGGAYLFCVFVFGRILVDDRVSKLILESSRELPGRLQLLLRPILRRVEER